MNYIKEALINVANFDLRATMSRRSYAFMIFVFPILAFSLFYFLIEFSRFVRLVLANFTTFSVDFRDVALAYNQIIFNSLYQNFTIAMFIVFLTCAIQRLNSITKNKTLKLLITILLVFLSFCAINSFYALVLLSILLVLIAFIKERHFNEANPKYSLAYFLTFDFKTSTSKPNLIILFSFCLLIFMLIPLFLELFYQGFMDYTFIVRTLFYYIAILIMPIIYIDIFYLLNRYKLGFRIIAKTITLISFIAFYIHIICFDRNGIFYEFVYMLFLYSFALVYVLAMLKIKNLK